ncbi:hypothetical protein M0R72_14015 [Candidatus Pacearchaeota archaeon]|jgi:hypothetical protein|nr:hypothetical protein [Candidatus Pacearchaeota archaeon]
MAITDLPTAPARSVPATWEALRDAFIPAAYNFWDELIAYVATVRTLAVSVSDMTGDEYITDTADFQRRIFRDPNGEFRDITPTGTWRAGTQVDIINTGASGEIAFDPFGCCVVIDAGHFRKFTTDGTDWRDASVNEEGS